MNRFCTACGKEIEKDASFCGACGKPVKQSAATPTSGTAGSAASSAASSSADTALPRGAAAPADADDTAATISRPLRPAADLPPESVFAETGVAGEEAGMSGGGAIPPDPDPAYFEVGDEGAPDSKPKWILGGGALLLLLLGGLYYYLFIADDLASEGGRPTASAEAGQAKDAAPEIQLFYASSTANIRDVASVEDGEVLGKLSRGDEARGTIIQSEGGDGEWLKLEDGQGFVFLTNLTEEAPPEFTAKGRKVITLPRPAKLLGAPSEDATIMDNLSKGLKITISGVVEGDYAEVLLRKGGVGYIAGGAKLVEEGSGPRGAELAIKLNEQGCAAGGEVDALYKKLDDRTSAELQKIEDADYPDDTARQAAIDEYYSKVEGKSQFQKLQRSFKGLQVSGIARHYEAQAIYFADPAEKVRKVFRDAGYKVGSDGSLPSADISAGIYSSRGDWKKYGATALECGV